MWIDFHSYDNAIWTDPSSTGRAYLDLNMIKDALDNYSMTHGGRLPESISQLVPEYLPPDKARVLPPLALDSNNSSSKAEQIEIRNSIIGKNDAFLNFAYLGESGKSIGIIVYETVPREENGLSYRVYLSSDFEIAQLDNTTFSNLLTKYKK